MKRFVVVVEDKDAVVFEQRAQLLGLSLEEWLVRTVKKEIIQSPPRKGVSVARCSPATVAYAEQLHKESERARKVQGRVGQCTPR